MISQAGIDYANKCHIQDIDRIISYMLHVHKLLLPVHGVKSLTITVIRGIEIEPFIVRNLNHRNVLEQDTLSSALYWFNQGLSRHD